MLKIWSQLQIHSALGIGIVAAVVVTSAGTIAMTKLVFNEPKVPPTQTVKSPTTNTASPPTTPSIKPTPAPTPQPPKSTPIKTPTKAVSPPAPVTKLCSISQPPASLGYDSFYQKYCNLKGFSIISASVVSNDALEAAAKILNYMTSQRPEVLSKLIANNVRYGIIGKNQGVLDMPEYKSLYDPSFDWNARSRGFGATVSRPLSSSGEENLLCLSGDRYVGESITVHEFSHTFLNMGLEYIDSNFRPRITSAYNAAVAAGKWGNTYAATNADEYWAEGAQDYFDTNIQSIPSNGIHNEINTRNELKSYDPGLYNLLAEVFPSSELKLTCQYY